MSTLAGDLTISENRIQCWEELSVRKVARCNVQWDLFISQTFERNFVTTTAVTVSGSEDN